MLWHRVVPALALFVAACLVVGRGSGDDGSEPEEDVEPIEIES
jgi:hypothetical protein